MLLSDNLSQVDYNFKQKVKTWSEVIWISLLPAKPPTKKKGKSKAAEPESIHVISSDEEGDDEKPAKVVSNGVLVITCAIIIQIQITEFKYFNQIRGICNNLSD